jgi:hypothetical protein
MNYVGIDHHRQYSHMTLRIGDNSAAIRATSVKTFASDGFSAMTDDLEGLAEERMRRVDDSYFFRLIVKNGSSLMCT